MLDFYCHEKMLELEVDGGVHDNQDVKERDVNRTFELENMGVRVIRFTNEAVVGDIGEVLKRIIEFAESL